jgi:hypothetical protein
MGLHGILLLIQNLGMASPMKMTIPAIHIMKDLFPRLGRFTSITKNTCKFYFHKFKIILMERKIIYREMREDNYINPSWNFIAEKI